MFAWIVTAVQIAAILVCPLTCNAGRCHGGSCCAAEASESPANLPVKPCCCCDKQDHESEPPFPAVPSKPACQGVCGGAIFEKACVFPTEVIFASILPADDFSLTVFPPESQPATHEAGVYASGNYGRSLRTLHASFLC